MVDISHCSDEKEEEKGNEIPQIMERLHPVT
jgi:hypothetical protein